jgi:hypothetical protein
MLFIRGGSETSEHLSAEQIQQAIERSRKAQPARTRKLVSAEKLKDNEECC